MGGHNENVGLSAVLFEAPIRIAGKDRQHAWNYDAAPPATARDRENPVAGT